MANRRKQCTRVSVMAHASRWCVVSRRDSRSPSDFSASTSNSALAGALIRTSHVSCGTAVITKRAVERPRARRSTASWGGPTSDPGEAGVELAIFGCGAGAVAWPDPQPPIPSAPAPAISEQTALRTERTLLRPSPAGQDVPPPGTSPCSPQVASSAQRRNLLAARPVSVRGGLLRGSGTPIPDS
jgi:hypothetical protein